MEHGTFEMTYTWEDENGNPKTSELEFEFWADNLYNDFEMEIKNCTGDALPEDLEEDAITEGANSFYRIMEEELDPSW